MRRRILGITLNDLLKCGDRGVAMLAIFVAWLQKGLVQPIS